MISSIFKSTGVGATVQTAELDDDAVTSAKIADLDADLTLGAGVNLILATTTGTKIGEDTDQLLGFYGATPVDQAAHIADLANDANGTAIATAVNAILVVLEQLGLKASS